MAEQTLRTFSLIDFAVSPDREKLLSKSIRKKDNVTPENLTKWQKV